MRHPLIEHYVSTLLHSYTWGPDAVCAIVLVFKQVTHCLKPPSSLASSLASSTTFRSLTEIADETVRIKLGCEDKIRFASLAAGDVSLSVFRV